MVVATARAREWLALRHRERERERERDREERSIGKEGGSARGDSPRYIAIARPPPHWFVEPLIGTALYQEIYIGLGCGTSGFSLKALRLISPALLLSTLPSSRAKPPPRWLTTITSPSFLMNVVPRNFFHPSHPLFFFRYPSSFEVY